MLFHQMYLKEQRFSRARDPSLWMHNTLLCNRAHVQYKVYDFSFNESAYDWLWNSTSIQVEKRKRGRQRERVRGGSRLLNMSDSKQMSRGLDLLWYSAVWVWASAYPLFLVFWFPVSVLCQGSQLLPHGWNKSSLLYSSSDRLLCRHKPYTLITAISLLCQYLWTKLTTVWPSEDLRSVDWTCTSS